MKKLVLAVASLSAALVGVGHSTAEADIKTSIYGFAKPEYYGTSNEFSNDVKPLYVESTSGQPLRDASRGQLSVRQSRFGINVDNESRVKLKMEFDLDGGTGNQVGVVAADTSFFRVRQANLMYKLTENGTLTVGKKWDIFSPLQPHSYQMTTIQFYSGNTGFLTDGIDYTHKFESATVAVELKNAGGNAANAADNTTVKLSLPIATVRADYTFMDQLVGVGYMAGKANYSRQDVTAPFDIPDANINVLNVYWNGKFGATDVIAEYYMGQNTGIGVVGGLGGLRAPQVAATGGNPGNAAVNNSANLPSRTNEDMGFYVSAKHSFEGFSVFGGYGRSDFAEKQNAPTMSFGGLVSNETIRLGADMDLDTSVKLFVEGANVKSSFFENGDSRAYSGMWYNVGMLARF